VTSISIGEVLDILLEMSEVEIDVTLDSERLRPSDVPVVVSDCSKFRRQTGWRPTIGLRESLLDVLNYWRERTQEDSSEKP